MSLAGPEAGASTIPDVLDALTAGWRVLLPGVQVTDGQPVGEEIGDDVVCVGFVRPGETAVESARTGPRLEGADAESYDIRCLASSWRGGETNAKAVRDGVFALIKAITVDLARDPRLGGLVMLARLSVVSFFQEQIPEGNGEGAGAVGTVVFTVHVDAYTSGV